MTWTEWHEKYEKASAIAMVNLLHGDLEGAREKYNEAANYELEAYKCVDISKRRTRGITIVSAVNCFIKANSIDTAKNVIENVLDSGFLPPFAIDELTKLREQLK